MDWTQSLTIIISNFGVLLVLFVYLMNRMDSNQKQTNEKMDSNKKELEQKISSDIRELKMDMNQRITDLKTDMNQRLSTIEGYLVPRKVFHIEEPPKEEAKEN
jgi:CHASE3 domain sensor protein